MNKFTEKDLAYISDMFDWNLDALKLVNHFMNEAEQEETKEILEEIFDLHYENLHKCISILNGELEEDSDYDFEEYDDTYEDEEDEEEDEEDE